MTNYQVLIDKFLSESTQKLYSSKRSYVSPGTKTADGGVYVGIDEVRKPIVDILSEILSPLGFVWKKSKLTFERKTKAGLDRIHILSNDYVHYHFHFLCSKRFDEIAIKSAAICYHFEFNVNSDYKSKHTISSTVWNELIASSFTEIKAPILTLINNLLATILPSLDEIDDLEKLHWAFNYPEKMTHNIFARKTQFYEGKPYFFNYDIINGLITADRFSHSEKLKFIEYYPQYELFYHSSGRTLTDLVSEGMIQLEK